MKMVSAAKFGRAEKELKPARAYGAGASGNTISHFIITNISLYVGAK